MNLINAENSLLLIIDVQEKLVNMLTNDVISNNAIVLAKTSQILDVPAIVTEQYPKGLGSTIVSIKEAIPNADYIEKTHFSALMEDNFLKIIEKHNKKQIIILGIETHICVLQTSFDLLNKGYEVFVVRDASGSRTKDNKEAALRRLIHCGAQIVTTEMVVFELLKGSRNPNFKEVQSLIK